jgi:hypothetical protein
MGGWLVYLDAQGGIHFGIVIRTEEVFFCGKDIETKETVW